MNSASRGFITVVIASGVFIFLGFSVNSFFHGSNPEHSTEKIDKMETDGAFPIELTDIDGNPFVLSDLLGSAVIVNFWASWCSPCIDEFPSMLKFLEHFNGEIKIVAISIDEEKGDIVDFVNAFGGTGAKGLYVLQDSDLSVSKVWGTDKIPESYILDKSHKLVKKIASSFDWAHPTVLREFQGLLVE